MHQTNIYNMNCSTIMRLRWDLLLNDPATLRGSYIWRLATTIKELSMNYHHWKHTYVTIIWRDNTFELCPKEHCCQNKAMTGTIPTTSTVKPVEIQHKLIWKYCLHSQNFIIQGFEALIEVCCRYLLIYLFFFFFTCSGLQGVYAKTRHSNIFTYLTFDFKTKTIVPQNDVFLWPSTYKDYCCCCCCWYLCSPIPWPEWSNFVKKLFTLKFKKHWHIWNYSLCI